MSDYITLLGAEDVRAASNTMSSAAGQMQSAANQISEAVGRLDMILVNFLADLREIINEIPNKQE